MTLAYQCFKLSLAFNNDHAEAYNNLAVLECLQDRKEVRRTGLSPGPVLSLLGYKQ